MTLIVLNIKVASYKTIRKNSENCMVQMWKDLKEKKKKTLYVEQAS